ncbi:MAG: hypothetical protein B1H12_08400 [Desulfobacteraceae bacterium 4484_190.2]|nr:MAG: hypothetical protein B1H12_08400 [Desulfobacteraceae bacterium 4484_190.2]
MFFELFLSLRYLRAKRKQAFISVITVISVLGVMIGVMALVVVLSVMNGFRADLMSKILGVKSHLLVLNYKGAFNDYKIVAGKVGQVEGVVATTPFIHSQVMVNRSGNVSGAILRGIRPQTAGNVLSIESMINSLKEAQAFLGFGDRVSGLEVRVKDVYRSDKVGTKIQNALGNPYWTKDWKVMNRSLFSALKLEKFAMFVILTMIVLVGALNIISTLVMVVMEKTRDVAILRAMGASAKSIMTIFMVQGLLVGLVGTLAGLASGLGICHLLARYKFISLPSDVYYITTLPVRVEFWDVCLVSLSAVVISFLATIYPSWHASKLNPVAAIRYE